jgi:hypothetical protein
MGALGEFDLETVVSKTVGVICAVKADQDTPKLQEQFFAESARLREMKY